MCTNFLVWWSGWSSRKLYPRLRAPKNDRTNVTKEMVVSAWFEGMKKTMEQIPDSCEYQLSAPKKIDVWKWYEEDVKEWPTVYKSVSKQHFYKIWRVRVPDVKLRKVLRFTKCDVCQRLRAIREDRSKSMLERENAVAQLRDTTPS